MFFWNSLAFSMIHQLSSLKFLFITLHDLILDFHQSTTELVSLQYHQFSSVTQSCPTPCDPMDCSMPGFPILHQHLKLAQTHVHGVGDAIQPSHPLSFSSPPALNLSQHQDLFQWVSSLHQVAKILEFQLQHQSFQWIFRIDLFSVQGTLKSLHQHHSSKASVLQHSASL